MQPQQSPKKDNPASLGDALELGLDLVDAFGDGVKDAALTGVEVLGAAGSSVAEGLGAAATGIGEVVGGIADVLSGGL